MPPGVLLHIAGQLAAAGVAAAMAGLAFSRSHVPGGRSFGWMNVAMVWWCLTGALHAFPQAVETRVLWATLQVAGIAAVPPFWLLFAGGYARTSWAAAPSVRRVLLAGALLMIGSAATNSWHGLYWPAVRPAGGFLSYDHGPLFWTAVVWNYALLLLAAVTLLRALRLQHRAFTGQVAALIGATMCPWVGNALYLLGAFPAGFEPTSLTFVLSGILITWGLYSHQLFDVVPAGRAAIFERMADAVFVLDRADRIVDGNAAAALLLGAPAGRRTQLPGRAIGRGLAEVLPWWAVLPKPPSPDDRLPVLASHGDRLLELQAETFADTRGSGGSLLWARDVTARRTAEIEHEALEKKLHEQRRLESMTVMAAGLSHDFNNLLTAMLGNADYIVATSPQGSDQRAAAEEIARAAQHAADLVTQMVAFSGEGRTPAAEITLADAVNDVSRALSHARGDGADITCESEPGLPPLSADRVQVRQAVLALVSNAVDAAAGSRVPVRVRTGRQTLDAGALAAMTYSAASPGEFLFVEVEDAGAGMPPDVVQRIFEPFYSTRGFGRGLGLAAVHGIVRSHRGAIRIWSAPGSGTRVRLWWPLS
ncbi:MAG TPA: histidine kinase N-terminal 7TM domain-containing protein [Vicinamibacterales bacterium]